MTESFSGIHVLMGLGNPGSKYDQTRHNIGFVLLDSLASTSGWKSEYKALTQRIQFAGQNLLLAKPQTYMNLSGESAHALLAFYKIPVENLIVVVDDVNLNLGAIRIRRKGGHGGHNGLRSIIQYCGEDFVRIRVGVGLCPPSHDLSGFVLKKLDSGEFKTIASIQPYFKQLMESGLTEGWEKAASRFNRAELPAEP